METLLIVCKFIGLQRINCLLNVKGKVKCTPCTGTEALYRPTAHRGSRGIALPFHDHGTRRWWGVSVTPRPLFTPGKDPVPIVEEARWGPGPVWAGAETLASTGIPSPNRPARSQSLYRLSYSAHFLNVKGYKFNIFPGLVSLSLVPELDRPVVDIWCF